MTTKEYFIDINYIKELKEQIINYYPENKYELRLINNLIDRMENNFHETSPKNYIKELRKDLSYYDFYKQYYPYIRTIVKNGIYIYDLNEPNYKDIKINNNDALTIAGDFFKNLDSFFYEKFNTFYKDATNHLEFIKPNPYTNGEIHFLKSFNEAFVYVPDCNNFTKISILIHELEHVIDSFSNPNFYDNLLIRECSAMFMEMISCDYLGEILNLKDDHNVRQFYIYAINKIEAENIYSKTKLLSIIKKHQSLKNKLLKNKLINNYQINKDFIKAASKESLIENYYYQLSFLIAIELYYIYQMNKELSLSILKDIIMNGNDQNFPNILNKYNIVLTKNIFNYENNLCLKLGI